MNEKTTRGSSQKSEKRNYVVSGDVTLAFIVSVEAASEEEAIDVVSAMSFRDLDVSTSQELIIDVEDVYPE